MCKTCYLLLQVFLRTGRSHKDNSFGWNNVKLDAGQWVYLMGKNQIGAVSVTCRGKFSPCFTTRTRPLPTYPKGQLIWQPPFRLLDNGLATSYTLAISLWNMHLYRSRTWGKIRLRNLTKFRSILGISQTGFDRGYSQYIIIARYLVFARWYHNSPEPAIMFD